ncbi:MAG TPA: PDZ domain-containing protein [Thermoanaerobaculia bacterium]|jgi:S1-C subfamily serine protease
MKLLLLLLLAVQTNARPGWLGMGFTHHTKDAEQWLIVRIVPPGGPADVAGVKVNDVVTAIDGKAIQAKDSVALLESMASIKPGQKVKLTIVREQKSEKRVLTAAPMTDEQFERWKRNLELAREKRDRER